MNNPDDETYQSVRCNNCEWHGLEYDLIRRRYLGTGEFIRACPHCLTDEYLMDMGGERWVKP